MCSTHFRNKKSCNAPFVIPWWGLIRSTPAITDHHQNTGLDAFLEILIPAPIQIISAIPDNVSDRDVGPDTISDTKSIPSHHEAQQKCQAISPAVKRSLIRWVDDMEASSFPPRLDLFKATGIGEGRASTWFHLVEGVP